MNNRLVLLKTLLLSTSQMNIYKHCKDKKKRGKIVGNMIGIIVLYLMIMAYAIAQSIGYGKFGLKDSIPVSCAMIVAALAFFLTFFKTNGYLFNFKEYDMLMSLPFRAKDVAGCKFLYMYIKSLPWYMSVSVAMMIGYGVYAKSSVIMYPIWIVLSLFLPIIPMLVAAFVGFIIAKLGSGFKNKTIAQTILVMIFIFLCFGLRFFLEDMFRNNKVEETLNNLSETVDKSAGYYLPAIWFSRAVRELSIIDICLSIGVAVILFEIVFILVGRSYKNINSALKSHASSKDYVVGRQKSKSILNTIAYKEFKRMTGSSTYMANVIIGEVMCVVMGVAVLFVDIDSLLNKMLRGAPLTKEMLCPAIPFIIYFCIGMVATTAFTPSLEGKNYWIVKSLPIKSKDLYRGKMLFNMYLTIPFTLFATITISFSAKASLASTLLYMVLGIVLCAFSTAWGSVCGIKFMRLDWENEVEVIKQSAGVTLYLLPNMFVTMGLVVLVVVLGRIIGPNVITGIMIVIESILAFICYIVAMKMVGKKGL